MAITSLVCLESAIWNTNHDAYRIALRLCMKSLPSTIPVQR